MSRRLESPRHRFESGLRELLGSVERTFGRAPRASGWILLVVAAAAGLAAGSQVPRALRRRGPA